MKTPKKHPSALHEQEGTVPSGNLGKQAIERLKASRRKKIAPKALAQAIVQGDKTALSRGITLVESHQPKHKKAVDQLIETCLPHANKSIRIGVTGVPGVGKSTFIETFGNHLIEQGKKVAVLAVDPSSSISKGSILGDKTRMRELVRQDNAFIRPSPSGDSLGGVSRKTRESILLCEAAGFDVLLIETVGVGQSETAVHSMTDFFLLLKLAGAGDELQGIKRGIMEMADAIAINKADGENLRAAKKAKVEFNRALHLYPPKKSGWKPKVDLCSAIENAGIDKIWTMILEFESQTKANAFFDFNRKEQNKFWLLQTIDERLKSDFYQNETIKKALEQQLVAIEKNETTPFAAASFLWELKKKINREGVVESCFEV